MKYFFKLMVSIILMKKFGLLLILWNPMSLNQK
jgi:hypothetical protein